MATPSTTPAFRDAKSAAEFLVGKLASEARLSGTPLRDVECRYLLADDENDAADPELEKYGNEPVDDLEERAVACLKAAFTKDSEFERDKYLAARDALAESDIYIGYMLDEALPARKKAWDANDRAALRLVLMVAAG